MLARAWCDTLADALNGDVAVVQSGPDGGRAAFDGTHGSMKAEGRRAIMAGG
jgi:hypothetical protein